MLLQSCTCLQRARQEHHIVPEVCTAALDVRYLVQPMEDNAFRLVMNVRANGPAPPLTGTIQEKAEKVLAMLQEKCAHDDPPVVKSGWIRKHCLGALTGLGNKYRPRVLSYMQTQRMIELEDRNGDWWIKACLAASAAAPVAPAVHGDVPAGLVALRTAAQQPSSLPQQQQQQQQQQQEQQQPDATEEDTY